MYSSRSISQVLVIVLVLSLLLFLCSVALICLCILVRMLYLCFCVCFFLLFLLWAYLSEIKDMHIYVCRPMHVAYLMYSITLDVFHTVFEILTHKARK